MREDPHGLWPSGSAATRDATERKAAHEGFGMHLSRVRDE
jgi:hypothetical protein